MGSHKSVVSLYATRYAGEKSRIKVLQEEFRVDQIRLEAGGIRTLVSNNDAERLVVADVPVLRRVAVSTASVGLKPR